MTRNPAEQIEVAQKAFYAMAERQCSLVLETLGESRQITNLSNNADLNALVVATLQCVAL